MAIYEVLMTEINGGECRSRSACTYVQSDLALHFPQNKVIFAYDRIKVLSEE